MRNRPIVSELGCFTPSLWGAATMVQHLDPTSDGAALARRPGGSCALAAAAAGPRYAVPADDDAGELSRLARCAQEPVLASRSPAR